MQVKIIPLIFAYVCLLAACQGRVIQEDELLEKPDLELLEPMVWLPEQIEPEEEEAEDLQAKEIFPQVPQTETENEFEIQHRSGCSITIRGGLKSKQPLYIKPGTTEFYPFSDTGRLDVPVGHSVEIHCTSDFESPLSGKTHIATCVSGSTFKVNEVHHHLPSLLCKSWPTFVAKRSGR